MYSEERAIDAMHTLLNVCEQLLFSFPLTPQIVEKYETMKAEAFSQLNLHFDSSHIWKLQREAYETQKKSKDALDSDQDSLARLRASHNITKSFAESLAWSAQKLNQISKKMNNNLGLESTHFTAPEFFHFEVTSQMRELSDFKPLESEQKELLRSVTSSIDYQTEEIEKALEHLNNLQEKVDSLKNQLKQKDQECQKASQLLKEEQTAHERTLKDAKKSQEVEELKYQVFSFQKENNELKSQLETARQEVQEVTSDYENKIQELSTTYKDTSFSNQRKVEELECSFQERESKLLAELEKLQTEDSTVLKNLRENNDRLQTKVQGFRQVLKAITERVSGCYNQFAQKDQEIANYYTERKREFVELSQCEIWRYYAETLAELDFIGYMLNKLSADNDWLVDRLDELSKSSPAKETNYQQVLSSLSANELVLKEFEDARSKLLQQFQND